LHGLRFLTELFYDGVSAGNHQRSLLAANIEGVLSRTRADGFQYQLRRLDIAARAARRTGIEQRRNVPTHSRFADVQLPRNYGLIPTAQTMLL
jgi:hypothetical protein